VKTRRPVHEWPDDAPDRCEITAGRVSLEAVDDTEGDGVPLVHMKRDDRDVRRDVGVHDKTTLG